MRRKGPSTSSALTCAMLAIAVGLAASDILSAESRSPLRGGWETDRVELTEGRVLHGLIEEESGAHVSFVEVRRSPGRPIALAGHLLPMREVVRIERLSDAARSVLRDRLREIRNRAVIEPGRRQSVQLEPVRRNGVERWLYAGAWFRLESTLEPSETRRIVVRLEQIFRAFAQVLPPPSVRPRPAEPEVAILVFGDRRAYAAYLRRKGLPIRNPAYFDPATKQVVVSSDLGRWLEHARSVDEEHTRQLRQLFPQDEALAQILAAREKRLQEAGYAEQERSKLQVWTLLQWRQSEEALVARMRVAERHNRRAVQQERENLQRRLFHEAFHAYAQTRLLPADHDGAPVWLSEGLAQVFESALFDADVLRIDAPDADRLERLQQDLLSDDPLSIARLLSADQTRFLVPHDASGRTSQRHYLYAWGLAYFLAFETGRDADSTKHLVEYVASADRSVAAFETSFGSALGDLEARWRRRMLELSPPGR